VCTALNTSKYILKYCNEKKVSDCSNKKLQKLLYYVQAWSLALGKGIVFDDTIEAWVHGPVVRDVYCKYKEFGFKPIAFDLRGYDQSCFTKAKIATIDSILDVYSKYDAEFLEMRTHMESPWLEARRADDKVITTDSMKRYYKNVLDNAGAK